MTWYSTLTLTVRHDSAPCLVVLAGGAGATEEIVPVPAAELRHRTPGVERCGGGAGPGVGVPDTAVQQVRNRWTLGQGAGEVIPAPGTGSSTNRLSSLSSQETLVKEKSEKD